MPSSDVRSKLEHCRFLLGGIAIPPALDGLAFDLIDHLIELDAVGRLTPAFLMLSMKAFEGVVELEPVVAPLAEIAAAQALAEGHREDKDRCRLPWVVSRYDPLDA